MCWCHKVVRRTATETTVAAQAPSSGDWIILRNAPASDKRRNVTVANQPFAGDNTASLEGHYQPRTSLPS